MEDVNSLSPTYRILGVADDGTPDEALLNANGLEFLGSTDALRERNLGYVIAVGSGRARSAIAERMRGGRGHPIALRHPDAYVGRSSALGPGSILCVGSTATSNVRIGSFVVVSPHAGIGHDAAIGDFATLMPGAIVSGNVAIGERSMVGANATVIQGLTIGDDVHVGAGAAVITDLPSNCTAVGVPARPIR